MFRILIAIPALDDSKYIQDKFQGIFEFFFCTDGNDFHRAMHEVDPDLLFLDLQLPNGDGLNLLRDLRAAGNMIPVVVTTSYMQDYIYAQLYGLDVAATFLKPWSVDWILDQISNLLQSGQLTNKWCLEQELDYILYRLGFRAGTTKFDYTRCAIIMRYERKDISLSKELYPGIARRVPGGAQFAEKGIRDCIAQARKAGDARLWKSFFPALSDGEVPTNDAFISRLANALRDRERPRLQHPDYTDRAVNE